MARSAVRDPMSKFSWIITIEGFSRLGFTKSGTPKYNVATREYKEGGSHLNPKLIVDGVSYAPITLERGVTNDTSFSKWASGMWDLIQNNAAKKQNSSTSLTSPEGFAAALQNNGADLIPSSSKYPFSYRRTVKIEHLNRSGVVEVVYTLYNCFPISYQPSSDFDSTGDDGLSIESLTLGYEGFDVRYTGISAVVGNIATGFIK